MAAVVTSTRTLEEHLRDAPQRARLLICVLHYDDLLREETTAYALPDGALLPLLIGRADREHPPGLSMTLTGSALRLADRWLSGAHAALYSRGDEDLLCDQSSRNGTYVNGKRVTEHILEDGDLIEVGHTLLCYRVVSERLGAALRRGAQLGPTQTFCPEVAAMVQDLDRIAASEQSVLILAETGCGKEVTAAMLHGRSHRKGPYYTVDCGAVPENLFESVFFGHKRGAFTGASADQVGVIQRAHGGTLFLDEVANMSLSAQAKLLRVVEDGRLVPLGAGQPQQVDVRWVAATNANLLSEGTSFRQDLLRRLAGFVARLPPLRRRREDLGVLSAYILREAGAGAASITAAAARRLFPGRFPGNIRQLRAVLRSAVLLAGDRPIDVEHLGTPEEFASRPNRVAITGPGFPQKGEVAEQAAAADSSRTATAAPTSGPELAGAAGAGPGPGDVQRRGQPGPAEIEAALQLHRGNVVRAARYLNTHPRQLYRWIERLGVDLSRFRE